MQEILNILRVWSANAPHREQAWEQNDADARFDRACEQAKMLGIQVAKAHRSMRQTADEDGTFPRITYSISAGITGTTEAMEYFKAMLDHTLPPPFKARTEFSRYEWNMPEDYGVPLVVRCCFCLAAFTTRTLCYRNTPQFTVERNTFCPHCRAKFAQGTALTVL